MNETINVESVKGFIINYWSEPEWKSEDKQWKSLDKTW